MSNVYYCAQKGPLIAVRVSIIFCHVYTLQVVAVWGSLEEIHQKRLKLTCSLSSL